jgi:hypothetical protein
MQYSTRLLGLGRVWWQFQQLREYSHSLARDASAEKCSGGVLLWRHEQKRMDPSARMTIWNPCVTRLGIQRRAGSTPMTCFSNVLVARHGYRGSWVAFHGRQLPVTERSACTVVSCIVSASRTGHRGSHFHDTRQAIQAQRSHGSRRFKLSSPTTGVRMSLALPFIRFCEDDASV